MYTLDTAPTNIRAQFLMAPRREAQTPNKPLVGCGSLMATDANGQFREAVCVRTYMSASRNASTVYACVWIAPARDWKHPAGTLAWPSGRGQAGGYGYHKESAAIAEALTEAGVSLFGNPYKRSDEAADLEKYFFLSGTGSSAYAEVFAAIAVAAGYSAPFAFVSHHL